LLQALDFPKHRHEVAGQQLNQGNVENILDFPEMSVKSENFAPVFFANYGNIAIKQVNIFPFLLKFIRKPPGFYPAVFFLVYDMKGIKKIFNDGKLLRRPRTLH
jgi:hypothetical protein